MTQQTIWQPKPLTADAFKPFGDVIDTDSASEIFPINAGYTQRFHALANVEILGDGGVPLISVFRSTPLPLSPNQTIQIDSMERHPLGSQAFMPLSGQPYLVVVAPKGEFNEALIEIFLAQPNQGVNYHAGTWHHFCLALNERSDFLVIDRGGQGHNCDEVSLASSIHIAVSKGQDT